MSSFTNLPETSRLAINRMVAVTEKEKKLLAKAIDAAVAAALTSANAYTDTTTDTAVDGTLTTFTPTVLVGGSETGITYASQFGNYNRIGNIIYFNIYVTLTSKGGGSGTISLGGLPVASETSSNNNNALVVGDAAGLVITAGESLAARIDSNSSTISLKQWNATSGPSGLQDGDIGNTFHINVSGHYFVAA